ncbi:hypothetical protein CAEBREN_00724 [Caenorhabditis brenneri]|uniref:Uncharacterized protein n=1 Tax=Caenorhabditis brenneri TaxID=135651 RepID=G0MMN6_CAEBE|nr:hypothetical protein CAEBREN_00724 [Caenorhabditis brenneri]
MAGFLLTPDEYDNPNPSKGYNLFADAYYKKLGLKTRTEKGGQARKAWEELSDFQRGSYDRKAAELRKLYRETHPAPKRLQSPYILYFTQESKKIRNAEGKQDLKNQIKVKNPLEFTSWTHIEPTFKAGEGFPWTKIPGPDGLATMELD